MIDNNYNSLITNWIDKNKAHILDKWIELIKIPSVKASPEDNAPFGRECNRALEKSAEIFCDKGFDSKVYNSDGYALAHYGEGEKTIGLFSHSDVVPVGEGWLFTSPFEPIIKEGSLIGRGAEDNKAGIMAGYCLFNFLKDNDITLGSKLELFIGSDEECGMQDLEMYLKNQRMPEVSIVPDADFPCSVGEKGIYHFWCESENAFTDIVDFSGGEAFNIVLDKAKATLKLSDALLNELTSLTENRDEFSLESDGETITVTSKGVAKHASIPEGSVNASELICRLLLDCSSLSHNDKNILLGASSALSSSYGAGLGVEHTDVNFGRLTTVNGMVKTENGKLRLSFDCRYGDTMAPDFLEAESEKALNKNGFTVIYKENSPGFSIDKNSKIPDALEEVFFDVTGEKLKRVLMSGGTYARKLNNAFSIGTSYIRKDRQAPAFALPSGHGGPHQCDEAIDIEGFFEAVRILIHYVFACDKIINE